jgi:hypothetical protein
MKKLILFLVLAFVMCGCNQYVTDTGIVVGVSVNSGPYKGQGKYIVEINRHFNAHYERNVFLYTDTLYTVGDTIQVTKKN